MEPETRSREHDWQLAIHAPLLRRLLRPVTRPGVIAPHLARRIVARLQRMSGLPLLERLLKRLAVDWAAWADLPLIVHARPVRYEHDGAPAPAGVARSERGAGRPVAAARPVTAPAAPGTAPPRAAAARLVVHGRPMPSIAAGKPAGAAEHGHVADGRGARQADSFPGVQQGAPAAQHEHAAPSRAAAPPQPAAAEPPAGQATRTPAPDAQRLVLPAGRRRHRAPEDYSAVAPAEGTRLETTHAAPAAPAAPATARPAPGPAQPGAPPAHAPAPGDAAPHVVRPLQPGALPAHTPAPAAAPETRAVTQARLPLPVVRPGALPAPISGHSHEARGAAEARPPSPLTAGLAVPSGRRTGHHRPAEGVGAAADRLSVVEHRPGPALIHTPAPTGRPAGAAPPAVSDWPPGGQPLAGGIAPARAGAAPQGDAPRPPMERARLSTTELDDLVDRALRKLMRQLDVEGERKGWRR